jgi:MoaA/NifB/PqqE/SkfB family radical SAM enzyme
MDINIDNIPCLAPFSSLHMRFDKYSVCCSSSLELDSTKVEPDKVFNSYLYRKLRKAMITQEGIPGECIKCIENGFTNQKFLSEEIKDVAVANIKNMNDAYMIDQFKVGHIFINFERKCNLSCRMCNPTCSTTFENKILDIAVESFGREVKIPNETPEYFYDQESIACMEIQGGEPFLSSKFEKALDRIGRNVELRIITNGMVYNTKILSKLQKFEKVSLYFSIDGIEEVNNYIRIGSDLKVVKENMEKMSSYLENAQINVNITLSKYNVFYLVETLNDMIKMGDIIDELHYHFVEDNEALRITSFNQDDRKRIIEKIESGQLVQGNLTDKCEVVLQNVLHHLKGTDMYNSDGDAKFKSFNRRIDERHNIHPLKIIG